jgi:hypothetical protein
MSASASAAVPVFALSVHASYACRHSGACCSVGWDVPVEVPVYRSLAHAISAGQLKPAAELRPFIVEPDLPPGAGAILERTDDDRCVFFARDSGLCVVHRDLGEPALPATCRYFPRLALADPRGTFITLSHFCPTAAGMLFDDREPLAIVDAPRAFPPGDYDGLTVGPDDLPPLLAPRMLMDLDGYDAWERHMIARCAAPDRTPETVVATLARDARLLRRWTPGSMSLSETVGALPAAVVGEPAHDTLAGSLSLRAAVIASIPDDLKPAPDEQGLDAVFASHVRAEWKEFRAPLTRFLAAKAFASWTAYQGRGIATIVRGLECALALVRIEAARQCRDAGRVLDADLLREAIRSTDFQLNHLAVGEELARHWGSVED